MKSIFCTVFAIAYKIAREPSKVLSDKFTQMVENTYLVTEKNESFKQSMGVRTLDASNFLVTK